MKTITGYIQKAITHFVFLKHFSVKYYGTKRQQMLLNTTTIYILIKNFHKKKCQEPSTGSESHNHCKSFFQAHQLSNNHLALQMCSQSGLHSVKLALHGHHRKEGSLVHSLPHNLKHKLYNTLYNFSVTSKISMINSFSGIHQIVAKVILGVELLLIKKKITIL